MAGVEEERPIRVLARLGREIARVMHRDELCHAIVRLIAEELEYERVSVWLFDERRGALAVQAMEGADPQPPVSLIPIDRGINGWVFRHGMPRLAPDVTKDPEHWKPSADCASEVAVPLVSHGETLGTLDVQSSRTNAFGEQDLETLAAVAPSIAAAIEVSTLHERLRDAALTDGLTGLANFRGFTHALHQEVARGKRYKYPFCVVMLDIDGLKAINDREGHLAGDAALRSIATDLKVVLRGTDVLARYGGDEFAVLLTQTTRPQAETTMKRFRDWTDVSVSYGISEFPSDGDDTAALLAAADRALYRSKRGGA
ncbi:MAG TPA: sensor domain-containing diguanylate cyclase [Candidatus Dormibacteraeota bacterium]|nr:sensor domain-containing diguanylate cyclase [Candidatus Dormibacteraeota bacterium]